MYLMEMMCWQIQCCLCMFALEIVGAYCARLEQYLPSLSISEKLEQESQRKHGTAVSTSPCGISRPPSTVSGGVRPESVLCTLGARSFCADIRFGPMSDGAVVFLAWHLYSSSLPSDRAEPQTFTESRPKES